MIGFYQFVMADIDGKDISLSNYEDKVVLVVNVASKCGFTPQYEGLEKIYLKYKGRGFLILGFPSNDFMEQEPGSNEEIKSFCSLTYGVTFPMFSKIKVKGKDIHPLYQYLTGKEANPRYSGIITWNFNKFLIDRKGNIINRFESAVKPEDKILTDAIEAALEAK